MRNNYKGTRRWLLLLLCFAAAGTTACHLKEKEIRYQAEFLTLFDTVTTIVGYENSKEAFTEQAEKIHDELETYHQLYHIYDDFDGVANIKTINDNAGKAAVKVDQKIIDLLKFAKEMDQKTGGKMNVAMGSVLSIWHDYRTAGIDDPEQAQIPDMTALREASLHTDINQVIIDEQASTVYLADSKLRLDVGAVAKGYAVERIADYMAQQGMNNILLSVGGNVRAIGQKADGTPWKVAIQNPDLESSEKTLRTLDIVDKSLVSSGDYERFYTVDGVRYHHIIDPVTLLPAQYFSAVSIVCRDSGVADALSTAIYNMPVSEGKELIESFDDVEAMWVLHDGTLEYSRGFP